MPFVLSATNCCVFFITKDQFAFGLKTKQLMLVQTNTVIVFGDHMFI